MSRTILALALAGLSLSACATTAPPSNDMHSMHGNHDMMMQKTETVDIGTLPLVQESSVMDVADGQTIDLDPTLVRGSLGAKEGKLYAYNGQFPGPTLRVKQGSTFTVRMRNKIDQPTTIHWHGLRLDNSSDGAAGLTQEAVKPGESHTYTVHVPDEGVYWYHPHVREDVQQDLGLYGAIVVTPKDDAIFAQVHSDMPVFVDDVLLDDDGAVVPHGLDDANFSLMGRFGNLLLTNGKPVLEQKVRSGDVVRYFFTNAANTRTFRIRMVQGDSAHTPVRMKLVGMDGGAIEQDRFVESVTLAPSERAIVDVQFPAKAGTVHMVHQSPGADLQPLGSVTVTADTATPNLANAFATLQTRNTVVDQAVLSAARKQQPTATLRLTGTQKMMQMHGDHGMMHADTTVDNIEWEDPMPMMNAGANKQNTTWKLVDDATGKENMDIRYTFKRGEQVVIRMINDTKDAGSDHPMHHPMHFHGQRFIVLSVNGKPPVDTGWKDTVIVPKDATVDILLDTSNPGNWMMHCHIAEHLTNGMMGLFTVE